MGSLLLKWSAVGVCFEAKVSSSLALKASRVVFNVLTLMVVGACVLLARQMASALSAQLEQIRL